MKTDSACAIGSFEQTAYACAIEMMNNALFIRQELPGLEMPAVLRSRIEELCNTWISCKHDVLNLLADREEQAAGAGADKANRSACMIRQYLAEDAHSSKSCVEAIERSVASDQASPLLAVLVMESAANVLRIFNCLPAEP